MKNDTILTKYVCLFLAVLMLLVTVSGCKKQSDTENNSSQTGITEIALAESCEGWYETFVGKATDQTFVSVESTDEFSMEDIRFISENSAIATVRFISLDRETSRIYFEIVGVGIGDTSVYVTTSDFSVSSNKIIVTVYKGLSEINITNTSPVTLAPNETYSGDFFVVCDYDITNSEIDIVSENPDVAIAVPKGEVKSATGRFEVIARKEGVTQLFITSRDGKICSEKVKVTVIQSASTQSQTPSQSVTVTNEELSAGGDHSIVYITPTGKKYHYKSGCAGANAIEISITEAEETHSPCKKCVK